MFPKYFAALLEYLLTKMAVIVILYPHNFFPLPDNISENKPKIPMTTQTRLYACNRHVVFTFYFVSMGMLFCPYSIPYDFARQTHHIRLLQRYHRIVPELLRESSYQSILLIPFGAVLFSATFFSHVIRMFLL